AHLVHHRSSSKCLDDATTPFSVDHEVMQQQADQLVSGQRVATAIHTADAIRVPVGHEVDVMWMSVEISRARRVVLGNRLWVDAAEQWIVFGVERRDAAGRAAQ